MTEKKMEEVVQQYEESVAAGKTPYLDADLIEDISLYYGDRACFSKAHEVIQYGLELYPGNADLLLMRVRLLLDEGRLEEAKDTCALVTEESVDLYLQQAELFLMQGEPEKAEERIGKVMEEEGEDPNTLRDIAIAYENSGFHGQAVPYLEKVVSLIPFDAGLYEELALDCIHSDQVSLGIEWLNKLLDVDPYNQSAWLELCKVHIDECDFDQAIEAGEYLLAINDECSMAYHLLGTCYFEVGNDKKAVECFERYKELEWEDPIADSYANSSMGMGYFLMENYDEALRYFLQVEDEGFLDFIRQMMADILNSNSKDVTNDEE